MIRTSCPAANVRTLILSASLLALTSFAPLSAAEPSVSEKVGATAAEVTEKAEQTGKAAMSELQLLWKRIDERRLRNRTPDEMVAWGLMGLLVGGLFYRFSDLGQVRTIILGLVGAFMGGILANVLQLNLGLGPVLIRYEDLLCSLIGGIVLFFAWKAYRSKKQNKAHTK